VDQHAAASLDDGTIGATLRIVALLTPMGPPAGQWLLRVELNDWQGALLGHSVPIFTIAHAPWSDQVTTIGAHAVNESMIADAEFGAIAALVEALSMRSGEHDGCPDLCSRSRAFCIALDYIRENASKAPSIEEICNASGVSWRTLDYAFRERLDLTPSQYLKAVRLKGVRRSLFEREPETRISEVAAEWGFWHMGMFALDYRRQFGELPSETARRS
jgi:AraC-like DNA-binding protein